MLVKFRKNLVDSNWLLKSDGSMPFSGGTIPPGVVKQLFEPILKVGDTVKDRWGDTATILAIDGDQAWLKGSGTRYTTSLDTLEAL